MAGQSFIAPSTALDRRRLGKFEVLCRLSAGGMSQIYLANQAGIGGFRKLVVLKTILPDIGGEEDFVRMFLEEARTTAAFNHPNIAQVYELDVDAGELFMAMEFVQGCTLVEMAKACRAAREPIPIGFTLQSVRDTALALHYAHTFIDARGRKNIVIHRDVAEKNIMVTYEGVTKLLDFGIAKALGRSSRTSVGMVKGTSGYMSPEQIRGEPLDARTDVFSLGVVLHECLTGLRLFHGKSPEEGMLAALNTTVAPPSRVNPEIRPELDAVVLKSLSRKRDDRYATALEFARAIEKVTPGLIWHPEQSGELVSRHFVDRRQETRQLLESANFGADTTGEMRIDALMAQVKSGDRSAATTLPPTPVSRPLTKQTATPPTGLPASLKRTTPAAPSPQHRVEVDTSPARPKVLRASSPPPPENVPLTVNPAAVKLDPVPGYADDSEAKTIPAAALPDEIKAMRAKLLAPKPVAQRSTEPEPVAAIAAAPAKPEAPSSYSKTIPESQQQVRTQGEVPATAPATRSTDWDDHDAKTAIEIPLERPNARRTPVSERRTDSNIDEDDVNATEERPARASKLFIAMLLVPVLIFSVLAVLYAMGLPPFAPNNTP